jgi:hypothetical protein
MKFIQLAPMFWLGLAPLLLADVKIDDAAFGSSLGGWSKRSKQAAEYPLSGSVYRTYKPEISPTPDGGLFVSIRIDHVRGWLSSDDHAILEITVNPKGGIASAQSNIAIQGRSITSDVILGTARAGGQVGMADHAVQVGTELIADLSAKLLREKIVEAGRVSFPAAIRHNYNLLFQAIRYSDAPKEPPAPAAVPVVELDDKGEPKPGEIPETPKETPPAAKASESGKPPAESTPQAPIAPETRTVPAKPEPPKLPESSPPSPPTEEPNPAPSQTPSNPAPPERDAEPLKINAY